MESTEQGRRARRSFTNQHKAEVVDLCRHSGKSMAKVARDSEKAGALHSRRSVHMFTVHALSALSFFKRRLARQSCSILSHRRSAPSTSTCAPA